MYKAHGDFHSVKYSGGGSCRKQRWEATREERIQIVKDRIAGGKNYGEIALKYRVSYQQVRNWTLGFEQMGEAGSKDRRGRRKKDQAPRIELEKAQDVTEFKWYEGLEVHKVYLSAILDLYD